MKWTPGGTSEDIEDRRDQGGAGIGGGGGFGGLGGIHLGIGGTIVVLVLSIIFRTNLFSVFSGGGGYSGSPNTSPAYSAPVAPDGSRKQGEKTEVQFVSFVIDDVQHTWEKLLPEQGNVPYRHAKLVLFRNATESACGTAQTASGPFYCPGDEKVYIDLAFYDELKSRFGAPGEFAQAYVLAHEVGHHVQKILGIEQKMRQAERDNPREGSRLSVALELQADCFAGVWGHSTEQRSIIDQADVAAGLQAAAAVGDDRIQKMATGHVNPETFTHGSSAQRQQWFQRGLDSGKISACNTFQGL